jgi:hypothetical protein
MKGAAIAYGTAFSSLVGGWAMVALLTLKPPLQEPVLSGMEMGLTAGIPTLTNLITELATLPTLHRWGWLIGGGLVSSGIWLKVIGLTQQIIRSDGDMASHLIPTLKHRLITIGMAIVYASLSLLAMGLILSTLPDLSVGAPPSFVTTSQQILMQGLRWGFAVSTMALATGMLYRSSQKSSAQALPILPGTFMATLVWLITWMALKEQFTGLGPQHWLWQLGTVLICGGIGLYATTLGVLLGGQYNKLIAHYVPPSPRSSRNAGSPPPPSFESFTIQKPPYR